MRDFLLKDMLGLLSGVAVFILGFESSGYVAGFFASPGEGVEGALSMFQTGARLGCIAAGVFVGGYSAASRAGRREILYGLVVGLVALAVSAWGESLVSFGVSPVAAAALFASGGLGGYVARRQAVKEKKAAEGMTVRSDVRTVLGVVSGVVFSMVGLYVVAAVSNLIEMNAFMTFNEMPFLFCFALILASLYGGYAGARIAGHHEVQVATGVAFMHSGLMLAGMGCCGSAQGGKFLIQTTAAVLFSALGGYLSRSVNRKEEERKGSIGARGGA